MQKSSPRIEAFKMFIKRLFKNKAAVIGGLIVIFIVFVGTFGPYLVKTDPYAQNLLNKLTATIERTLVWHRQFWT